MILDIGYLVRLSVIRQYQIPSIQYQKSCLQSLALLLSLNLYHRPFHLGQAFTV